MICMSELVYSSASIHPNTEAILIDDSEQVLINTEYALLIELFTLTFLYCAWCL